MSFIDIKDPWERDAKIKDYIATKKRIQQRNEDEKAIGLARQVDLEQTFNPVVESTEKSTAAITKAIKNITKEVANINEDLSDSRVELPHKRRRVGTEYDNFGPLAKEFKKRTMLGDASIDRIFGIRFVGDGRTVIGNTPVTIDGDDIIIQNEVYHGTPGLWSLITDTNRDAIDGVGQTDDDYDQYMNILYQTSALNQDYDPENSYPRASRIWKWRKILKPIWNRFKKEKYDDASDTEYQSPSGSGLKLVVHHPIPHCRVYLHKNGQCCSVLVTKNGKGLYLTPYTSNGSSSGDGLFIKAGRTLYKGEGLLDDDNSALPPILKDLLKKKD